MSWEQIWLNNGRPVGTASYFNGEIQGIPQWSSSSSQRSIEEGASNGASDNRSISSNEPETLFDATETQEQRLERWQKFYTEGSMERWLNKDDYELYLDDIHFNRLYQEVQHSVYDENCQRHRGQEQVRNFWDDVRKQLRDEEETVMEWPPAGELHYCTAWEYGYEGSASSNLAPEQRRPLSRLVGGHDDFPISATRSRSPISRPGSPTVDSPATGQDAEFLKLREWLMRRKRMREELNARLGR